MRFLFAFLAGAILLPAASFTSTWSGGADNQWNNPGNWNNGVPQNGADLFTAVITSATNNPVLLGTSVTVSGLNLGSASTLNLAPGRTLTVDNGSFTLSGTVNGSFVLTGLSSGTFNGSVSSVTNSATGVFHVVPNNPSYSTIGGTLENSTRGQVLVDGGAILQLQGGTYHNDGTFAVNGGSLWLGPGNVNFTGNGTLSLNPATVMGFNSQPATLSNGLGHTIQGNGLVMQEVSVQNAGTVTATGGILAFNGPVSNTGTMQSVAGGTLNLNGPIANSGTIVANGGLVNGFNSVIAGGTLAAQNQGRVNLEAATIGATVNINDGGTMDLTNSTLAGVTTVGVGGTLKLPAISVISSRLPSEAASRDGSKCSPATRYSPRWWRREPSRRRNRPPGCWPGWD